jgi:hypothetical protein
VGAKTRTLENRNGAAPSVVCAPKTAGSFGPETDLTAKSLISFRLPRSRVAYKLACFDCT